MAKDFSIDNFIGNGIILDVRGENCITMKPDYASIINEKDIVLLFTGFDQCYLETKYFVDHPVVSDELADFLLSKKIKMLGMDLPSPDHPPFVFHKNLLNNGIFVLENLTNLEALINLQAFEVIALPLKIAAEASPVRAICRVKSLKYRLATIDDIDLLVMQRLLFIQTNKNDSLYTEIRENCYSYFHKAIHENKCDIILAENNDICIGTGIIFYYNSVPSGFNVTGKNTYITSMYVQQDYRRKGIGMTILNKLISISLNKGYKIIMLSASEMGKSMYEKVGFIESKKEEIMEYKCTFSSVKKFADAGKLEDWIHTYLLSDVRNKAFSDGLKIHDRYFIGPIVMPLLFFKRCTGPEKNMKYQIEEKWFEVHVNELQDVLKTNDDMPPLIANYVDGHFELNDGNHRFEALTRLGRKDYDFIIWITDEHDYEDFLHKYKEYI